MQTILITGCSSGFGLDTAKLFLGRGWRVIATMRKPDASLLPASERLTILALDVTDAARIAAAVAAAGPIDALVNNAARFTRIDPLLVTEADWDFIHSTNLKAYFFCAQQAARQMLQQDGGGRIVNISSIGGVEAWPMYVHYCASKAGIIHMSRAMARAWAPKISVNSVAPGAIPFEEADSAPLQELKKRTPAGRFGTGDEIADAVVYYLTATQFVTGQLTIVDGGLTLA